MKGSMVGMGCHHRPVASSTDLVGSSLTVLCLRLLQADLRKGPMSIPQRPVKLGCLPVRLKEAANAPLSKHNSPAESRGTVAAQTDPLRTVSTSIMPDHIIQPLHGLLHIDRNISPAHKYILTSAFAIHLSAGFTLLIGTLALC